MCQFHRTADVAGHCRCIHWVWLGSSADLLTGAGVRLARDGVIQSAQFAYPPVGSTCVPSDPTRAR
jgi:hypothetical protein